MAIDADERDEEQDAEEGGEAGDVLAVLIVTRRNDVPRVAQLGDARLRVHMFNWMNPGES